LTAQWITFIERHKHKTLIIVTFRDIIFTIHTVTEIDSSTFTQASVFTTISIRSTRLAQNSNCGVRFLGVASTSDGLLWKSTIFLFFEYGEYTHISCQKYA
jgi:hypothetical protein